LTGRLIEAHKFLDGMADEDKTENRKGIVRHAIKGILHGTVVGAVTYTVGTIATNTIPAVFPVGYGAILGAIGFTGAVAISLSDSMNE